MMKALRMILFGDHPPPTICYTHSMKIYIAADHRGFNLKEKLKLWLTQKGHDVIDCGNDHLDPQDDYVDFGLAIARKLAEDITHSHKPEPALGIGICGSGVGMTIAANRIKGIRAALSTSPDHIKHARENDHVNILALPAEYIDASVARDIVTAFLTTSSRRIPKYIRRSQKLDQISGY